MRHDFSETYRAEDAGRLVQRVRCVRCGMGSTWAGARDACSAPALSVSEAKAARSKLRSRRWREAQR